MTSQPEIRLPLPRLAGRLAGVIVCAGVLAAGFTLMAAPEAVSASLMGAMCVLVGTILGIGFLSLFGSRSVLSWGALIIAGSMIRIVVAVGVGVWLTLSFDPAVRPLWLTFLAVALPVHVVEVAVLSPVLKAATAREEAVPGKALTDPSMEPVGA